ncbi:MAG: alanine--tRNA ligase [Eubacteriaceae bacterium]|nr:alanine--tRNA ligase [Eubacteriaceae bacterium]
MKPYGLNTLREKFLKFFETKDHMRLKSFSLVPVNDKSLLLINSGMAPLKPYFTGDEIPPSKRVATCQKCIRTPDIDNVGKTARHGTFFEMLGNFSFGDYFKKEVIPWSWEFCTECMEMDPEKIFITIYLDDDEAFDIWHNDVGIPKERIVRLGKEDNFWEHGTGPCGPCSELHYDRGPEYGCDKPDCAPGCDCDRYVEFWNLVFTQFDRLEDGSYVPLDNPNIDTGMGLERLATVMQQVDNIFEVDTIRHILNYVCELAGVTYGEDPETDVSIRVITDHIRSVVFMIGDGIMPGNEGRGYVLRRLLRRAVRHGKLLGIDDLFLYKVVSEVVRVSKDAYEELGEKEDYIQTIVKIEEQRFKETIDQGLTLLEQTLEDLEKDNKTEVSGEIAFKLYDTYGFPIDLTREMATERGFTLDEEGFKAGMEAQRERARKARMESDLTVWADDPFNPLGAEVVGQFVGYDNWEVSTEILGLIDNDTLSEEVHEGAQVLVLLKDTPFYAESGGQVGDKGTIEKEDGSLIEIEDTQKGSLGRHLQYGKVLSGSFKVGEAVTAKINGTLRAATQRNHTATHLLQEALRRVLGEHVEQAGSLVAPDRLRFDFNHFKPVTREEIKEIEKIVNEAVLQSHNVNAFETGIEEAKALGATALFGEKYDEIVRVIQVGDYSIELCGGCHLTNSSQAGLFKIVSEGGVAAGIRRIEAVTGMNAFQYVEDLEDDIQDVADKAKTTPDHLVQRVEELLDLTKSQEKTIQSLKQKTAGNLVDDLMAQVEDIQGNKTLIAAVPNLDMEALRNMSDMFRDKMGSGMVLLGTTDGSKVNFIASATKDMVSKGFHAGKLIKEVATIAGGGGGGRPDMAQAGGKKPEKIQEALETGRHWLKEALS